MRHRHEGNIARGFLNQPEVVKRAFDSCRRVDFYHFTNSIRTGFERLVPVMGRFYGGWNGTSDRNRAGVLQVRPQAVEPCINIRGVQARCLPCCGVRATGPALTPIGNGAGGLLVTTIEEQVWWQKPSEQES